jgi:small subunit ribosomal protein S1
MESSVETTDKPLEVKPKMHYTGQVLKTSLAGAVIDIGVGQPAVIHISQLISPNEEPIKRVEDVLQAGASVEVWVKKVKEGRIELTMFKPLDLEWRDLKKGMVVKGTVVRLEKFGAFVEIGAERPGLIHISEMAHGYVRQPSDVVKEGEEVEAEILDVNRKKKQIKLSIKALQPEPEKVLEEVNKPQMNFEIPQPKEKTPRRVRKPGRRKDEGFETDPSLLASIDKPQVEADPTYMEIAMREAMEKAKSRKNQDKGHKAKGVSREQEDILSRTLEHKSRSS